jgi:hypothetical protein
VKPAMASLIVADRPTDDTVAGFTESRREIEYFN